MKRAIAIVVAVSALLLASSDKAESDGPRWISLFDGRSLSGWTAEQTAKWRVADEYIVGDAGGDGWLRSRRRFRDFTLKLAFRNSPKGNSGVFLRATRESNVTDPSNPRRLRIADQ
jgi:hypothetical protein